MIRGPKYKIARRLGAPVFEKTQTQKFKLSEEKKSKGKKRGGFGTATNFALQLKEKQKARYTYGVSEKQFKNYVKKIIESKVAQPQEQLFIALESRLDNAVARIGLGSTRAFARQLVSHGHITINGKKVTIPSYKIGKGDVIGLREGSKGKNVFKDADERSKTREIPNWLAYDADKKVWNVQGAPKLEGENLLFDLDLVIQYYKR
jgi:small subunit ribosomal protein S4